MECSILKLLIPFVLVLPGVIAGPLSRPSKADTAYPHLVSDLLPVGLRGLVLAGLIAILMSSMSACYNASAALVVRDFFMRWKAELSDREQIAIGRRVTVLMAALAAVIFVGLLWKRGNTAGAISGGAAGFGLGVFLFPIRPSAGRWCRTLI